MLACPECGSLEVVKAVMAPNVGRKSNQASAQGRSANLPATIEDHAPPQAVSNGPLPPEALAVMQKLAALQAQALKNSRWVGENFAEDARAMHYGERDAESIHGQATIEEAQELLEEGIEVAPLPFPVAVPGKAN